MEKAVTLTFTADEAEILVDALDADLEGYLEAAKEARGNNRRSEVETYTQPAERIAAVRDRVRAAIA